MSAARWLVKSEPHTYSFDHLVRDGRTVWDGVRNNTAALHLKAMRQDDEVLFYHSNVGMAVVGIAKVAREAFPDPSDPANRFVAVELSAVRALTLPVTLAEIKATPALAEMAMLRQGRLSVSPVSAAEWETILRLAGG
jgi:predicted RNA-binding protein with PUA-like domain